MFTESGYHVAKRVLSERKARSEFFVQLEMLRKEQLKAGARSAASSDGERMFAALFSPRMVVG